MSQFFFDYTYTLTSNPRPLPWPKPVVLPNNSMYKICFLVENIIIPKSLKFGNVSIQFIFTLIKFPDLDDLCKWITYKARFIRLVTLPSPIDDIVSSPNVTLKIGCYICKIDHSLFHKWSSNYRNRFHRKKWRRFLLENTSK